MQAERLFVGAVIVVYLYLDVSLYLRDALFPLRVALRCCTIRGWIWFLLSMFLILVDFREDDVMDLSAFVTEYRHFEFDLLAAR